MCISDSRPRLSGTSLRGGAGVGLPSRGPSVAGTAGSHSVSQETGCIEGAARRRGAVRPAKEGRVLAMMVLASGRAIVYRGAG